MATWATNDYELVPPGDGTFQLFRSGVSIEEDRGDGRPREQRRGLHELGLQPPSHQPPPTEERTRRGMVRQKVAATAGKGAGVARWERVTSSARCKASLCGLYSF